MQLDVAFLEPAGQRLDGTVVVIVEMRSRGEQLDGVEALASDLDDVLAREPLVMEQMGGHAEALLSHGML